MLVAFILIAGKKVIIVGNIFAIERFELTSKNFYLTVIILFLILDVEVRFPKFRGQSHLQLPPLRNAYKDLQFTIEFRPEQTSGLLLYSGEQRDGSGDFASMAIVDGYVEFR